MCDTCGCGNNHESTTLHTHHSHSHSSHHSQHHGHAHTIEIQKGILSENDQLAQQNRDFFSNRNIFTLNFVSSPGSGKTTILEQTISHLKDDVPISVIEGDQQTSRDADRIHETGVPVVQVNTGAGCHLDAHMIHHAMSELPLNDQSILFIENVGNLVCPALFDLGEAMKVVIISVTEGEDKPEKYPHMFDASDICIINKIDLLPYVDFNVERCKQFALQVNRHLTFFECSATTPGGLDSWIQWIIKQNSLIH